MTLMSCRRAEKLMPLYAAGDLPAGRQQRAVAAHVARCSSCAALSQEFRASREWVQEAAAVPEFGDDFYERLRAGVLDEIDRDTRPAAPGRFAPFFAPMFAGRRLAYAASLALAACALALAFYLFRGAEKSQGNGVAVVTPPRAEVGRATPELSHPTPSPDGQTRERQGQRRQPSTHDPMSDGKQPARPAGDTGGGGSIYKRTPTLRRAPHAEGRAPELAAAAVVTALARQGVEPNAATPAPRADTLSVARIEIQTADPNIRIIWLAPDKGEEAQPARVDPDR
jgi:hypothetical protein